MISCTTCPNRDSCNEKYVRAWSLTGSSTGSFGCQSLRADLRTFEVYQRELPADPLPSTRVNLDALASVYPLDIVDFWQADIAVIPESTSMSLRDKKIVDLRNQGLPTKQIGKGLGLSDGAVRIILHRIRKRACNIFCIY